MQKRNEQTSIFLGIILLFGMHFAAFWVWFLLINLLTVINSSIPTPIGTYLTTGYRWLPLLFLPGLTQLIYVIPLGFWLKRKLKWGLMKGVVIGAVITALLNGGCFLLLTR